MNRCSPLISAVACLLAMVWTAPASADFFKAIRSYPDATLGTAPVLNWAHGHKPLVVVRYPAAFAPDAVEAGRTKYIEGPYYAFERDDGAFDDPQPPTFDRMLTSSMYYAAEFTEQLRTQIPGVRVVMTGGTIGLDANKKFVWIDDATKPAADVLIDFTAYVWPQQMAVSIGGLTPIVSINVAPVVAPELRGSVSSPKVFRGLGAHVDGSHDPYQALGPNLVDLLNYTGKKETVKLPPLLGKDRYIEARPFNGSKIVSLRALGTPPQEDKAKEGTYVLPESFKIWSYLTIDALNMVSAHESAKSRPDYAAAFDPGAAAGLDETRLATLTKLRAAEAEFMNSQSDRLIEAVLKGSFGDSFRVTREKELATARKANTVGWLGVLAAGATMGVAGSTALVGMAIDKTHDNMTDNFNESVAAVLKTQVNVAVQVGNEEMTIAAANLASLRGQLVQLYRKAYGLPPPTEQVSAPEPAVPGPASDAPASVNPTVATPAAGASIH
jgi:hypothetical protein